MTTTRHRKAVDPVLYTGVVLRMQRGERRSAVEKVQEELELGADEAGAVVDHLWQRYQKEIPPDVAKAAERGQGLWISVLACLVLVVGVAGWVLMR